MDSQTGNKALRFGCPACGIRLVVDQSVAGTEGPCPSCGGMIVAPPVEVASSLVEKQAAPLAIKPRAASAKPKREAAAPEEQRPSPPRPDKSVSRGHGRSVSPNSIMSEEHTERQNMVLFLKILAAFFVIIIIACVTYLFLENASVK